eukprot:TRINITY_DN2223_c0_g1_i1.p2 TRINITY_DN2223_c0_g1~~TRINITY_DN2223_c0_g1_i1.p2  ORF type:complete len:62 (+),score=4.39 TRINITY_DN2223_c0_g1_i1:101-286(+)
MWLFQLLQSYISLESSNILNQKNMDYPKSLELGDQNDFTDDGDNNITKNDFIDDNENDFNF